MSGLAPLLKLAAFLSKVQAMTKSIGKENVNRAVTLPLRADLCLSALAGSVGESVAEFMRKAALMRAESISNAKAQAFKAAMNHKQQIASTICLMLLGLVYWQTIRGSDFERVGSRAGIRITSVKGVKGRRIEVEGFDV